MAFAIEVEARVVPSGEVDKTLSVSGGSTARTDAVKFETLPYPPGYKMTFSVWSIGAAATDIIVNVCGAPFTVHVDTTWSRCECVIEEPAGRDVIITPTNGTKFWLYKAQLETGELASDWVPSPDEFYAGSAIRMNEHEIYMATSVFEIDINQGAEILHIDEDGVVTNDLTVNNHLIAPNIAEKYTGGTSISIGASSSTYLTLTDLANSINNRIITGDVVITLSADVYDDTWLGGMNGVGSITVNGGNHTIVGNISVYNQNVPITFNSTKFKGSIGLNSCKYVAFNSCNINGNNGNVALFVGQGTKARLYSTLLYKATSLIMVSTGSTLVANNSGGQATTYFLNASESVIIMSGTRPDGSAQISSCLVVPDDPGSLTPYTGSGDSGPVAPVQTLTYSANQSSTYYEGNWYSSSDALIRQGIMDMGSGGKKQSGCMWFNTSTLSTITTVRNASLTLTRMSGKGGSIPVEVYLYGTKSSYRSGNAVSGAVSYGKIGEIGNGETKTFTISVSAVTALKSGTISGLMLQAPDTTMKSGRGYSQNYAVFYGAGSSDSPVLTVTGQ